MQVFTRSPTVTALVAATVAACFSGCSITQPARHVRLTLHAPAGALVDRNEVREVVRWNVGEARLSLAPQGGLDDLLNLWVAIENDADEPFAFDPSHIQYAYCYRPQKPHRSTTGLGVTSTPQVPREQAAGEAVCAAFRPVPSAAQVAAHLTQRDRQRRKADHADEAAAAAVMVLLVFAVVLVIAAAASGGSSSGSGGRRSRRGSSIPIRLAADLSDATVTAAVSASDAPASSGDGAAVFDAYEPLRRAIPAATIDPGTHHAGHIFIPPDLSASSLRLQFQLGSELCTLEFDYRPATARRSQSASSRL